MVLARNVANVVWKEARNLIRMHIPDDSSCIVNEEKTESETDKAELN